MSEDGGPPNKRTRLPRDDYDKLSKEELIMRLQDLDSYVDTLQSKHGDEKPDDPGTSKETEDKLKQQQVEATRRENVLVMRLTTKEQEMQEYLNQIQELKQVRNPATTQLRGMLLDPAINLMFQRMKKEMDSCKEKLERAQNDLTAWKFTPDSQTGKRLMAKCRMLLQENEELGKVISAGRTAKLEGEIALEKKFVEEMKKSQAETDEFLVEMDEDMEGMQSTIYFLQQQLKDAKDEVVRLRQENQDLQQQTEQQQDVVTKPFPNKDSDSRTADTIPNAVPHPQHAQMDVDVAAERDSYSVVDRGSESTDAARTASMLGSSTAHMSHSVTGNNVSSRTNSDSPREGEQAMVSTSTQGAEHRALQAPDTSMGAYSQLHPPQQQQQQQHQQQTFNKAMDDSKHSTTATNGDRFDHMTMEMDISQEMQNSCDDGMRTEQSNCHVVPHGTSERKTLSPQPNSPLNPSVPVSNVYNHAQYGISHSSDGAYTYEGTDASSDPWSPSNQSKTSGMVSDDEPKPGSCGSDRLRTEKGCIERLQNGLITSSQYDTPETGIAE